MEKAMKSSCPRCKGFGSIIQDKGEMCDLCNGDGYLWSSKSGWTMCFSGKVGESEKLY